MGGVTDEDHPAGVPGVELDPFARADMELLVAPQGRQVRGNRPAEAGEAAPEPFQPSRQGSSKCGASTPAEPYVPPPPTGTSPKKQPSPMSTMSWATPGGRVGTTLRQAMVPANAGSTGLTASRRTVEEMPSAPTTRSKLAEVPSLKPTRTRSVSGSAP